MRLSKAILKEACAWQVRLGDEHATPADVKAFEAWLAADPRHAAASQRIILGATALAAAHLHERPHRPERPAPSRRAFAVALAASAAVAIGLAVAALAPKSYTTAVGEQRTVKLADGSIILLNTNTLLFVRFSEHERHAALQRGEAFFDVAPDPRRPFVVEARGSSVRAVGTQFAVRVDPVAASVLVVEGTVAVSKARPHAGGSSAATLSQTLVAGQQVDLTTGSALMALPPSEVQRRLAWRTGWVEFNGQPLSLATREVARYHGVRFVIDPQVGKMRIVARFRVDRLEGFLSSLANFDMLEVERRGDEIHIRHRPEAK